MARSRKRSLVCQFTLVVAFLVLLGTVYLILSPDPQSNLQKVIKGSEGTQDTWSCDQSEFDSHQLAVVVPFRDRFEELLEFVPYMNRFLCRQKIRHKIIVINQVDSFRFNRASLINIGFLIGERLSCDYIAMHDVDLLPMNDELSYSYPADGPFHIAAPDLHPNYHYSKFVGGILLLTNTHFRLTNGLTNNFWGWGREDDEFYLRMIENNLQIHRPTGISTGNKTFKHLHDTFRRPRDNLRYGEQKAKTRRDHVTGLNTTVYMIESENNIVINGSMVLVVGVRLQCNIRETPWCFTPKQLESTLKDLKNRLLPQEYEDLLVDIEALKMIKHTA